MIIKRINDYATARLYALGAHRRKKYLAQLRSKNKNLSPSIISNNCIAGIMYHDLGLRFLSPTINLFFAPDDYIEFVDHLEHYIHCVPEEVTMPDVSYPVGVLSRDDKKIFVYFMHYTSFDEAWDKWVERAKRVDFKNLYVIFEYASPFTASQKPIDANDPYYKAFKAFPHKKRMITYSTIKHDNEIVNASYYKKYHAGIALEYPKPYSKKRYLDCLDYNEFLNDR